MIYRKVKTPPFSHENLHENGGVYGCGARYEVTNGQGSGAFHIPCKRLVHHTVAYRVKPIWNEKTTSKRAEVFVATVELDCKLGTVSNEYHNVATYESLAYF